MGAYHNLSHMGPPQIEFFFCFIYLIFHRSGFLHFYFKIKFIRNKNKNHISNPLYKTLIIILKTMEHLLGSDWKYEKWLWLMFCLNIFLSEYIQLTTFLTFTSNMYFCILLNILQTSETKNNYSSEMDSL